MRGGCRQSPAGWVSLPAPPRPHAGGCAEVISWPDVAGFLLASEQHVPVVRAPCQISFHARKEEKLLMINCATGENTQLSNLLLADRCPFLPRCKCSWGEGGELFPRARCAAQPWGCTGSERRARWCAARAGGAGTALAALLTLRGEGRQAGLHSRRAVRLVLELPSRSSLHIAAG